jgi:CRISPR/Cas system-associated exonuclease Cas4 (RecB family)
MDLLKLRIRDIYLSKPKWLKRNTEKVHLKRECHRKDILRLDDEEGVRKNRKIVHLGKNDLVASPALRERRILGGKLGSIKKFPKNSLKY